MLHSDHSITLRLWVTHYGVHSTPVTSMASISIEDLTLQYFTALNEYAVTYFDNLVKILEQILAR